MSLSAEAHYQHALSCWRSGQHQDAIASLVAASTQAPADPTYLANLAAAYVELKQWKPAEDAIRQALALAPDRAASWHGLGNALTGQQRWLEAAQAYETAANLNPDLPNCDSVAAQAWTRAGEHERAARRYVRAISGAQGRDDPELLTAMAKTLTGLDQLDAPLELYLRVATLLPHNAAAQSNLGISYQAFGRYTEAIACYRKALALDPALTFCWTNLIACLNYSPDCGPQDLLEAARGFDVQVRTLVAGQTSHVNDVSMVRPLRVGYVSPDLHRHPVAYFLLPLLQGHSGEVYSVCYSTSALADEWTTQLRQAAGAWVDCADWPDDQLARKIAEDRIDILVDLTGHTDNNRLLVFARKPAPVQVSWMGYVTTTGLQAMDWRMTYPLADPPGADADYSEKLWRLGGGMWGYRPLPGMPEVAPPPHERKGVVTFAHLNRFPKVSRQALSCWAEILQQVPGSRLAIGLPQGSVRRDIARFFEERGVAANRIDAYDKMPHAKFWAMHGEIDIALDPFPFNGGTTSYETLWLGVPLVTCTGGPGSFAPRFSSRMGAALLTALGLPELVAADEASYVAIAVGLARSPQRMTQLRKELRTRMAASELLDEALHVREIEAAYRGMWQQWCTGHR